ncbi:MAG: CoA-transferase, partial [Caldimonas sp.]
MIQKEVATLAAAVADVPDDATVMIGGFGTAGLPNELVGALLEQGAR